jgi:hypothetical protein
MIDTDKYEGHTPADDWEKHLADALFETEFPITYQDNQLIADAPLLLAEVKRLRDDNKKLHDAINGCAYANMQGSALDLYCESIIERCPICDENVESGLCNEGCEEE